MTDPKSVGKDLGKTRKEAERNLDRMKPNFPYSQRSIDDVDIFNTYTKEFNLREASSASLDLDIKERPAPCTVNPPEVNSYHHSSWGGDYIVGPCKTPYENGYLLNWRCLKEDATTGGYEIVENAILLPYDGCYLVEASWGGYGVSYFKFGSWEFSVFKHGSSQENPFQLGAGTDFTGIISILGPPLHYMPIPNRLIGMVEAKAGDGISTFGGGGGFNKCYPWFGTNLRGMGVPGASTLKITLIALAEDILPTQQHDEYGPDPINPTLVSKNCILGNTSLMVLNDLVTFYTHLTSKGEVPYPNQGWTTEEQWAAFWADYWSRLGWVLNTGDYPFPAPETFIDSLPPKTGLYDYQAEWTEKIIDCPPITTVYDAYAMNFNILNQLTLLSDFYYSTTIPFYISISGSTEPTIFNSWETFWAWVWDRGYSMEAQAYDMEYVWTEARNILTGGITPWPPATTIGEIEYYITLYSSQID